MLAMISEQIIESDFFNSFNWKNFEYGDLVWLEDCTETDCNLAYFVSYNEGGMPIMQGLNNQAYKQISEIGDVTNLHQVIGA